MIVSAILAIDETNIIGINGSIPWNIPEDLKRFKFHTEEAVVIMGAKTWDSLPIKPLPNRKNIIISSSSSIYNEVQKLENTQVRKSLVQSLTECLEEKEPEVFLIGGVEIFNEGFDYLDKIYLTKVHQETVNHLKPSDTYTMCLAFNDLSMFQETVRQEREDHTFTISKRKR